MSPRILLFDLENTAGLGYFWGSTYDTSIIHVVAPSRVMSFAAKWHGDPRSKTIFQSTHHDAAGVFLPAGDGREGMLRRIAGLLDEADAVISYNGARHDTPHITTEFMREGVDLPSPYREIDLYKVTRAKLKLHQNKLQSVLHEFGLGSKVSHEGFPLWLKCMAGDEKAWGRMARYNRGDVIELEKVYDFYLPLIPRSMLPNWNLYTDGDVCSKCGGRDLQRRGKTPTLTATYPRFWCKSCGGWSQGKKAIDTVNLRGAA